MINKAETYAGAYMNLIKTVSAQVAKANPEADLGDVFTTAVGIVNRRIVKERPDIAEKVLQDLKG